MKKPMTAKEKANELINKFAAYTDIKNNMGRIDHDAWDKRNKQCALIAVEEIIKVTPMYTGNLKTKYSTPKPMFLLISY